MALYPEGGQDISELSHILHGPRPRLEGVPHLGSGEVTVRDDEDYATLLKRVRIAKGGVSPRFDRALAR